MDKVLLDKDIIYSTPLYEQAYNSEGFDSMESSVLMGAAFYYRNISSFYDRGFQHAREKGSLKQVITWLNYFDKYLSNRVDSELTQLIKAQIRYVVKNHKKVSKDDILTVVSNLVICKKRFKLGLGIFEGPEPVEFTRLGTEEQILKQFLLEREQRIEKERRKRGEGDQGATRQVVKADTPEIKADTIKPEAKAEPAEDEQEALRDEAERKELEQERNNINALANRDKQSREKMLSSIEDKLTPLSLIDRATLNTINGVYPEMISNGFIGYYNSAKAVTTVRVKSYKYSFRQMAWDIGSRMTSSSFNSGYSSIMRKYIKDNGNTFGTVEFIRLYSNKEFRDLFIRDLKVRFGINWLVEGDNINNIEVSVEGLGNKGKVSRIKYYEYDELLEQAIKNKYLYGQVRALTDLMMVGISVSEIGAWLSDVDRKMYVSCAIPYKLYAMTINKKVNIVSITPKTGIWRVAYTVGGYWDEHPEEIFKLNKEMMDKFFIWVTGKSVGVRSGTASTSNIAKPSDTNQEIEMLKVHYRTALNKFLSIIKNEGNTNPVLAEANRVILSNLKLSPVYNKKTPSTQRDEEINRLLASIDTDVARDGLAQTIEQFIILTAEPKTTNGTIPIYGLTKEPIYTDILAPLIRIDQTKSKFIHSTSGYRSRRTLHDNYVTLTKNQGGTYQYITWNLTEALPANISKCLYNIYIDNKKYTDSVEMEILKGESLLSDMYYLDTYLRYGVLYECRLSKSGIAEAPLKDTYIKLAGLACNRPDLYAIVRATSDVRHGAPRNLRKDPENHISKGMEGWIAYLCHIATPGKEFITKYNILGKIGQDNMYSALFDTYIMRKLDQKIRGSVLWSNNTSEIVYNMHRYLTLNLASLEQWRKDSGTNSRLTVKSSEAHLRFAKYNREILPDPEITRYVGPGSLEVYKPEGKVQATPEMVMADRWKELSRNYARVLSGGTLTTLRKQCNDDYDMVNRILFTLKLLERPDKNLTTAIQIGEDTKAYNKFISEYYKKTDPSISKEVKLERAIEIALGNS